MAKPKKIYQLKVTLKRSKPPIWRRLLVSGNSTLGDLHDIIQIAMGWDNEHLHHFKIGDVFYEDNPGQDTFFNSRESHNEEAYRLEKIIKKEKFRFEYEYDFGDSWIHDILVEKILEPEKGEKYPICIAGELACPPEDIGGLWGYYHFLEAINDPKHPDHEDMLDWRGQSFDAQFFDIKKN